MILHGFVDLAVQSLQFIDLVICRFQVSVPVHLLQSRNDLAVPEFVTTYVASHLRTCVVEYLPIEGHLPHLAQPELMTEAIRRHIEQPP
jgi:pimeloyl-ACP methyl ester carboxylesterase